MAERLAGKVALITGGCSGIGLGTVELFVNEGARVVVADVQADAGRRLEQQYPGRLKFTRCDVREEADVQNAIATATTSFGQLDILFNNAGAGGAPDAIEAMSVAGWDNAMALLLRSVMLGIKHAIPVMKAAGGGAIVNTASIAGMRVGIATTAYSVAKAGVLHLTRIAAADLAAYGIRVNAICPGVIPTPSLPDAFGGSRDAFDELRPTMEAIASKLQPINRSGQPRDIAEMCLFLASDAAGFISGGEFVVDGALIQRQPEGYAQTVGELAQAIQSQSKR
ncbi:MAG: glucose 1-dehydrogenase [Steroidobacteraceae bacterium]